MKKNILMFLIAMSIVNGIAGSQGGKDGFAKIEKTLLEDYATVVNEYAKLKSVEGSLYEQLGRVNADLTQAKSNFGWKSMFISNSEMRDLYAKQKAIKNEVEVEDSLSDTTLKRADWYLARGLKIRIDLDRRRLDKHLDRIETDLAQAKGDCGWTSLFKDNDKIKEIRAERDAIKEQIKLFESSKRIFEDSYVREMKHSAKKYQQNQQVVAKLATDHSAHQQQKQQQKVADAPRKLFDLNKEEVADAHRKLFDLNKEAKKQNIAPFLLRKRNNDLKMQLNNHVNGDMFVKE